VCNVLRVPTHPGWLPGQESCGRFAIGGMPANGLILLGRSTCGRERIVLIVRRSQDTTAFPPSLSTRDSHIVMILKPHSAWLIEAVAYGFICTDTSGHA